METASRNVSGVCTTVTACETGVGKLNVIYNKEVKGIWEYTQKSEVASASD